MTSHPPLRVVVGEDQPIFRAGVVHVLAHAGFDVVGETTAGPDVVRKARAHLPDIVVLDIHAPLGVGGDGLLAAREIRTLEPRVALLALSQLNEDRHAIELLGERPQGVGYLLKDRIGDVDSFVEAVRRVAGGGSVIDADLVGRLVHRRGSYDSIESLTPRELDVLVLMADGRSNQGIAADLVVTLSAVERHVTGIFAKLGLPPAREDHRRVLAVLRYLRR